MRARHFPGSGLLFELMPQRVDAYAAGTPLLDLRDCLSGPLTASGIFFGLSGRVERRFTIAMTGRWSGRHGKIDERFRYDNGETGERSWELEFVGNENFHAIAHDVMGRAKGVQRGNAATMRYRLRVPRSAGDVVVGIEDWFYLIDDGTLINRARMTKFGFKVGEVVAFFRKGHDPKSQIELP